MPTQHLDDSPRLKLTSPRKVQSIYAQSVVRVLDVVISVLLSANPVSLIHIMSVEGQGGYKWVLTADGQELERMRAQAHGGKYGSKVQEMVKSNGKMQRRIERHVNRDKRRPMYTNLDSIFKCPSTPLLEVREEDPVQQRRTE